jgi:hypothetical protein
MLYDIILLHSVSSSNYTNLLAFTTFSVEKFFAKLRVQSHGDDTAIKAEDIIDQSIALDSL